MAGKLSYWERFHGERGKGSEPAGEREKEERGRRRGAVLSRPESGGEQEVARRRPGSLHAPASLCLNEEDKGFAKRPFDFLGFSSYFRTTHILQDLVIQP
jgi:hypothetical protein